MERLGALARVIPEEGDRVEGCLSANFIRDDANLARLHPYIFCYCSYFHLFMPQAGRAESAQGRLVYPLAELSSPLGDAAGVSPVSTSRCKFTELVADHVFGDEHRNMLASI